MREQQTATPDLGEPTHFARDLALYTIARLGMLAATIAVLVLCRVPLTVAAIVSVILVMPLSMLVFGPLRRRVALGVAQRRESRRQRRAELERELRGERGGAE